MLQCHGCIKQCLQTIIGRPASFSSFNPRPITTARILKRTYASDTNSEPRQHGKVWSIQRHSNPLPGSRFEQNRQEWLKSRGTRPPSKAVKRRPNLETEESMKKHFQYLQDPLKLASYIRTTLRNDDFETAEKVVQYASKTLQCVVSWNHLVDWQLSKGKLNGAIKTFNEMKKRAQTPDAHTYTIIFRGCAEHKDSTLALEKVLAIYQTMLADKAPVKPNTIHVNAVLKMCAKAHNMESMFAIADQLPEKGLRAPNNLTYTTILNGLRMKLLHHNREYMTLVQQRQEAQNSILTARHIWSDIVKRWRKGDIWIDEELVCAMGRLLLMGGDRDADDILTLIEQSMSIPRQTTSKFPELSHTPPLPDVSQKDQELEVTSASSSESNISAPSPDELTEETTTLSEISENQTSDPEELLIPFSETIVPINPPKGVSAFPIPGQNTLSLLLAALLKLRDRQGPQKYWTLLTTNGVQPDAENYNAYLRTLRVSRSSSEAVRVLLSMPKDFITIGTYRIAIASCVRDKMNQHAFENATKIVDLMSTTHSNPDLTVLHTYLEVAITSHEYVTASSSRSKEGDLLKFAHGAQISLALDRLHPAFTNLKADLSFSQPESVKSVSIFERDKYVTAVLQLARGMIGACDVLMDQGMIPRDEFRALKVRRNLYAAYSGRHKHLRREREDKLKPKWNARKSVSLEPAESETNVDVDVEVEDVAKAS